MKALAQDLGIAARGEFTGHLDDVTPALREADFYLSTLLSEGMSNSVLEAMSFGMESVAAQHMALYWTLPGIRCPEKA